MEEYRIEGEEPQKAPQEERREFSPSELQDIMKTLNTICVAGEGYNAINDQLKELNDLALPLDMEGQAEAELLVLMLKRTLDDYGRLVLKARRGYYASIGIPLDRSEAGFSKTRHRREERWTRRRPRACGGPRSTSASLSRPPSSRPMS